MYYWMCYSQKTFTEANINETTFHLVDKCVDALYTLCAESIDLEDNDIELVLQVSHSGDSGADASCQYYFVDHVRRTLFWLQNNVQATDDIFYGLRGIYDLSHIGASCRIHEAAVINFVATRICFGVRVLVCQFQLYEFQLFLVGQIFIQLDLQISITNFTWNEQDSLRTLSQPQARSGQAYQGIEGARHVCAGRYRWLRIVNSHTISEHGISEVITSDKSLSPFRAEELSSILDLLSHLEGWGNLFELYTVNHLNYRFKALSVEDDDSPYSTCVIGKQTYTQLQPIHPEGSLLLLIARFMHYFSMSFVPGTSARNSLALKVRPSSSTSAVCLVLVSMRTNLCTRRSLALRWPVNFRWSSTPCFFGHHKLTTTIFEECGWMIASSSHGGMTSAEISWRSGLESQSTCVPSCSTSYLNEKESWFIAMEVHCHASSRCEFPRGTECIHSAVAVGRSHCYLCLNHFHHRVPDYLTPAGTSDPKIWTWISWGSSMLFHCCVYLFDPNSPY